MVSMKYKTEQMFQCKRAKPKGSAFTYFYAHTVEVSHQFPGFAFFSQVSRRSHSPYFNK